MSLNDFQQRSFYHSIRFKLLLVALTLAAIPWAGYRYMQETEAFLRQGQEKVLLGTAQAIATVLHNREDLFTAGTDSEWTLYVHPLHSTIQLDGYTEDWEPYLRNTRHYDSGNTLAFDHIVAEKGRYLYVLFQIKDDSIVYRSPGSNKLDRNDHLQIALEQSDGTTNRYLLATSAPGWVNAHQVSVNPSSNLPAVPETRIKGEWQETADGYTIEIRIPRYLLGNRLAFAIADVDDPTSRHINTVLSTAGTSQIDDLGILVTPSPGIEHIISSLEHEDARIWVLDGQRRVLAQKGTLTSTSQIQSRNAATHPLLRTLFQMVLQQPTIYFKDDFAGASRLHGAEIESALTGQPEIRRRHTSDGEAIILSAAWPIRSEQGILGTVLVEQSTNEIQSLQNEALERLFSITIIFFVGTSLVLLGFASFLTARIRKLRNQVEAAVTTDGRITGEVKASHSRDEIGDLGRSFSNVLSRLGEYNRYLEAMASRLAHELRTPLTVVKTSLENIEVEQDSTDRERYLLRAKDGANRLGLILHRMREATRLEQLLQQSEPEKFNLTELVQVAAENYSTVYPESKFNTTLPESSVHITGTPDLISQALDKLISNAVDFHTPNTSINIELNQTDTKVSLSISNKGPPLPESLHHELFESMVSVRPENSSEPHLGLGLYLVRLICEFHGGKVEAANLPNNSGVVFKLALPVAG
ncbi:hypothetical protein MNBD_GAMMA26-609 [hydrothermal vent metagenome]|uniref:histidine kinase n=1 Tax=hydrothermal vent metagenome TaxID=652676 RepID=A0A3B1B6I6_9ZZZZ